MPSVPSGRRRARHWHDYNDSRGEGYQFMIFPLWFNGRDAEKGAYAGLFPVYGRHPHILMAYDLEFALWPLWTRYRTPRPSTGEWLETKAVLFPFLNWRSDGSWALWPVYGVKHQRESTHRYALWPIATWAFYEKDRDTSGEGYSWMFWPVAGRVSREREAQTMFLPPFFSWTETSSPALAARGLESEGFRLRCPWPFFDYETGPQRDRISVFPLYENSVLKSRSTGSAESSVTRFGGRLVEIYRDDKGEIEETRVFPFWAKGKDYLRVWPFWESDSSGGVEESRFLSLVPIRWIPSVLENRTAAHAKSAKPKISQGSACFDGRHCACAPNGLCAGSFCSVSVSRAGRSCVRASDSCRSDVFQSASGPGSGKTSRSTRFV